MISIDRLEEMTIEELQIKLKNFEEQIKLQNNFIDSLFKATNNSEWLDKSMLDDEVSEVIEKIELDYEQLDQLKAENEELTSKCSQLEEEIKDWQKEVERIQFIGSYGIMDKVKKNTKLEQTLTEIKEIAECCKCHNADGCYECKYFDDCEVEDEEIPTRDVCKLILQKISEVSNDMENN